MDLPQKAKKTLQPSWLQPMLATLVEHPFSDKEWLFEKKFDGVRCLAFRKGGSLVLYSRNKKKMNQTYPEIRDALQKESCQSFIVDGEIVAEGGKLASFSALQRRMNVQSEEEAASIRVKVAFHVFDLLYYDGYDFRSVPLIERKRWLKKALSFGGPIRYAAHTLKEGERFFREACKRGWEGAIAKRSESRYLGGRSKEWLKFKAVQSQEFVIGGYTAPEGSRVGFGALLIGYYEKGKLCFAGKVGTGYDVSLLKKLSAELKGLSTEKCPFQKGVEAGDAYWVKPLLVCEVGFTEWTREGKLRHPRFLGLRRDKGAKEVERERGQ